MTDRYLVLGNPVAHSLSPRIHAEFARATGEDIDYGRELVPLDGFAAAVSRLRSEGVRGANVTVPFKEAAFRLSTRLSDRARAAEAVNTLSFHGADIFGDNTDGMGLVTDLRDNLGVVLTGRRLLLVGAGGAARGVLLPLLGERPAALVVANRTPDRARGLAERAGAPASAAALAELAGLDFDVVINATSASLSGAVPPLPDGIFAPGAIAYDMVYARDGSDTPFLAWARARGAARLADGLGMLVAQAAEAFYLWRGVRPATAPVLAMLRS